MKSAYFLKNYKIIMILREHSTITYFVVTKQFNFSSLKINLIIKIIFYIA